MKRRALVLTDEECRWLAERHADMFRRAFALAAAAPRNSPARAMNEMAADHHHVRSVTFTTELEHRTHGLQRPQLSTD